MRYKRLMKEIPKHKHAKDALIASGFSKNTAEHEAKTVLQSAMKYTVKEMLNTSPNALQGSKQLMNEILGLTCGDIMLALKNIALQEKDYSSALKVLAPLAKEHGVVLQADDDQRNVTVPIINLGFAPVIESQNTAKNIEAQSPPIIDDVKNG